MCFAKSGKRYLITAPCLWGTYLHSTHLHTYTSKCYSNHTMPIITCGKGPNNFEKIEKTGMEEAAYPKVTNIKATISCGK